MPTMTVATRISPVQLAKARDGLLTRGIKPENLMTKSNILRLALFLAILANPEPDEPPSKESLAIVESG